jgi:uncharacterized membrane protein HdeD (DUF308 family)
MKKNNWVLFVTNGVIAILLGLMLLFAAQETLKNLVSVFGVILIVAGAVMFYASYRSMKSGKSYLLLMAQGIVAILVGIIIAINPGKSLNLFLTLVGIWAAILGLLQIIVAIRLKKKIGNHYVFTINGVLTLAFGLLLFFSPMTTSVFLSSIIGVLSLLAGLIMIYLGIKVKSLSE